MRNLSRSDWDRLDRRAKTVVGTDPSSSADAKAAFWFGLFAPALAHEPRDRARRRRAGRDRLVPRRHRAPGRRRHAGLRILARPRRGRADAASRPAAPCNATERAL